MLKIYGSPHSSAGRCYWMLEEIGVPYERVPLDMRAKQHKSEGFLKLNPAGKVPVLIDGDFVLWESAAINSYLAEKYKPELLGRTIEERALVNQWTLWAMTDLQPPHVDLLIQLIFIPEERRDLGVIEKARAAIIPKLAILDQYLLDRQYMVGSSFTLADINVGSVVNIGQMTGGDTSQFKNIAQWFGRLADRPSRRKLISLDR
jgi:glutathione S-transferase